MLYFHFLKRFHYLNHFKRVLQSSYLKKPIKWVMSVGIFPLVWIGWVRVKIQIDPFLSLILINFIILRRSKKYITIFWSLSNVNSQKQDLPIDILPSPRIKIDRDDATRILLLSKIRPPSGKLVWYGATTQFVRIQRLRCNDTNDELLFCISWVWVEAHKIHYTNWPIIYQLWILFLEKLLYFLFSSLANNRWQQYIFVSEWILPNWKSPPIQLYSFARGWHNLSHSL